MRYYGIFLDMTEQLPLSIQPNPPEAREITQFVPLLTIKPYEPISRERFRPPSPFQRSAQGIYGTDTELEKAHTDPQRREENRPNEEHLLVYNYYREEGMAYQTALSQLGVPQDYIDAVDRLVTRKIPSDEVGGDTYKQRTDRLFANLEQTLALRPQSMAALRGYERTLQRMIVIHNMSIGEFKLRINKGQDSNVLIPPVTPQVKEAFNKRALLRSEWISAERDENISQMDTLIQAGLTKQIVETYQT